MRMMVAPILFMLSAGIFFEEEKRNLLAVGAAGILAIAASVFTITDVIKLISERLPGQSTGWAVAIVIMLSFYGMVLGGIGGEIIRLIKAPMRTMRDDDVLADQDASRPTSTIVFAILSALFGAWVSMDKYIEGPTSPETANLHLFMVIFMALGVPLFTELAALAFFSDRHQSGDQAKKDEAKR